MSESKKPKILVVDDDGVSRTLLRDSLRQHNYDVVCAKSGEEALGIIKENGEIDVMLLDIIMPILDGFEMLGILKANPKTRSIKIIILTVKAKVEDKIRALSCGASDYVIKPFEKEELIARIETQIRLKRTEEDLKRAKDRYEELFEGANELNFTTDANGLLLKVNRNVEEITGCSKEELLGKNAIEFVHPDDKEKFFKFSRRVLKGERPIYEVKIRTQKKDLIYVLATGRPIEVDGKVAEIQYNVQDITEQKQAECKVRESEERFRVMFNNSHDLISIVDPDGKTVWANPAWYDTIGYMADSQDDQLKKIHPEDKMMVQEAWQAMQKKEGDITNLQYRCMTSRGDYVFLETTVRELKVEGKPLTYIVSHDITDRKKSEEELARMACAVKGSIDSIVVCDIRGNIVDLNDATLEMYGTDRKEDLIGKNAFSIIASEGRERIISVVMELLKKGHAKAQEYYVTTKNNSKKPVEISINLLKNATGKPTGFVGITRDITERKYSEKRELKIKDAAIETSINAIIMADMGGKLTYANPYFLKVWRYATVEEVKGKDISDFFKSKEDVKTILIALKETGSWSGELIGKTKKDLEVNVQLSANVVEDENNEPIRMMFSLINLTRHKLTWNALEKSEERCRALTDSSADGIFATNENGYLTYINPALEEMFGVRKAQVLGANFKRFLKTESSEQFEVIFNNLKTKKEINTLELEMVCENGSLIPVEVNAAPIMKDDKFEGMICTLRDITERKRAEEEIKNSEERLKILFENAPDCIFIYDWKGNLIDCNITVEKLTGYKREELIGKNGLQLDLMPKSQIPKVVKSLAKKLKEPSSTTVLTLIRKDGSEFTVEVMSYKVKIKDQILILGIAHDITEHKRLEEELQESYDRLQVAYSELKEVDQMKTDFVSVVTHELRTPLTIIRNNFEMFLDGTFGDLNEVQNESMEMLFKNINRLVKVVQDSLEMSRIYGGRVKIKPEPLNIGELFEKIVSDMKLLAEEKGHVLSLEFSEGVSVVECDGDKITQVLTNLLYNAIKFTPDGGKISVNVKNADENGSILVEVKDNGIGIPKDEHENIFKQFYEVDSHLHHGTGGTGLGLSIAKGIVEAHGGKIWVESTPEVGSTFSFTIRGKMSKNNRSTIVVACDDLRGGM